MFKQTMMAMAIVTATQMLGSSAAEARFDPLRCEARRAGCEKRYFKCLSRCGGEQSAVGRPAVDDQPSDCETNCDARHSELMQRINEKSPCVDKPTPADPNDCEVQLLNTRRAHLVRLANCHGRQRDAFDVRACEVATTTACETRVDEVMSQPVCTDGRAGSIEICGMP